MKIRENIIALREAHDTRIPFDLICRIKLYKSQSIFVRRLLFLLDWIAITTCIDFHSDNKMYIRFTIRVAFFPHCLYFIRFHSMVLVMYAVLRALRSSAQYAILFVRVCVFVCGNVRMYMCLHQLQHFMLKSMEHNGIILKIRYTIYIMHVFSTRLTSH